jgi:transcriptional regulator with XRE-family HTH domain
MNRMIKEPEFRERIATAITKALEVRGMTQGDLARVVFSIPENKPIPQSKRNIVSKWISGKRMLSGSELINLAEALNASVDSLLGGDKKEKDQIKFTLMEKLSKRVNHCIESGDVTIADIAKACGCSRQHIYKVIAGKSEPTISLAEKLADSCGFSLRIKRKK